MSRTLDEILDDFERRWRQDEAPSVDESIEQFLRGQPDASVDERNECLAEIIKIDLEFRWKRSTDLQTSDGPSPRLQQTRPSNSETAPAFLEEYLQSHGELSSDVELLVELIGEEFRVRTRWGDRPTIEEYSKRFTALGDKLNEHLGAIQNELAAESLAPGDTVHRSQIDDTVGRGAAHTSDVTDSDDLPRRLGDYDLLEELGVGGMGTVFRALQRNANREVALKVVRHDRLQGMSMSDRAQLVERFRTEALAAGRLEHDHIVRVYEVGEHNGQPFFSMQWVHGPSLSTLLLGGPVKPKKAAEYAEPIAQALAAAHRQGVLHRDVKPHNVLLDSDSDRPLIADFGLAKLLDASDELTHHGDIMGTPQYMSPEQADGRAVSQASDVYGLGATLYHMLTGRPPFQSPSVMDIIKQVISDDPIAPRQLDSNIDRDLETICLKCLEKDPSRRYATAEELAADLHSYRVGKPIAARPISTAGRAWRWCQRNRTIAALSTAVAVAVLLALVGTTLGYWNATRARAASEAGFRDARSAFDDIVERIRDERTLNEPRLQDLKEDLLQKALDYYEAFLNRRGNDQAIRQEVAETHYRVGLLQDEIVSPDAALESFGRARVIQADLAARSSRDTGALQSLGMTLNAVGKTLAKKELLEQAEQAFEEAAAVRSQVVELAAGSNFKAESLRLQANTEMNLGILAKRRGQFESAMTHYQQAQRIRESALEAEPTNEALQRDLAKGLYNIGHLHEFDGDVEAAERALVAASRSFQSLLERNPADAEFRYSLLLCYRLLGDIQVELAPAIQWYQLAGAEARLLVDEHPTIERYQEDLAAIATNLGQTRFDEGNFKAALVSYEEAVLIMRRLTDRQIQIPAHRRNLALAYFYLSEVQAEVGETEAAMESLDIARSELQSLVDELGDQNDRDLLEEVSNQVESLKTSGTDPS